jgi:hypothetical protein
MPDIQNKCGIYVDLREFKGKSLKGKISKAFKFLREYSGSTRKGEYRYDWQNAEYCRLAGFFNSYGVFNPYWYTRPTTVSDSKHVKDWERVYVDATSILLGEIDG